MPKPRTLVGAWRKLKFTWEKLKVDPDFEFETITPDSNFNNLQKNNDPLIISIGDLTPKSITY